VSVDEWEGENPQTRLLTNVFTSLVLAYPELFRD